MPASRLVSSALRHTFQYLKGDREEDHLAAAVWNLMCILEFEELGKEEVLDLPRHSERRISED